MKPNRCKQKLTAGQVSVGHMIVEFGTRGVAKMLENAGVDFVLIDTEHSAFAPADIADLVAWFKATDIAPFVRVPEIQYHLIARTLDQGALGIMVPNVKNGHEAQAIIDAAKYAPLGQRGVMLGSSPTDYRNVDPAQFFEYANANTTVICQIESVEGVANLEAIASTPGVDVLWVGHFDLTQSMGIPGQFHHARFLDAMHRVVDVAHNRGLAAGIQPGNLEQAQGWLEMGFNILSFSTDLAVYGSAVAQGVAGLRKLAEARS